MEYTTGTQAVCLVNDLAVVIDDIHTYVVVYRNLGCLGRVGGVPVIVNNKTLYLIGYILYRPDLIVTVIRLDQGKLQNPQKKHDKNRKNQIKEPELKTETSKEKGFEEMRYYEPCEILFLFSHLSPLLPLSLTLALSLPLHSSPLSLIWHLLFLWIISSLINIM